MERSTKQIKADRPYRRRKIRSLRFGMHEKLDHRCRESVDPDERIAAMEILRRQWYKIYHERPARSRKVLCITP